MAQCGLTLNLVLILVSFAAAAALTRRQRIDARAGRRLVVAAQQSVVVDERSQTTREVLDAPDTLQEVVAPTAPLVVALLRPRA